MIPCLPSFLHERDGGSGIDGGLGQECLEVVLVHVVRARAGAQASSVPEDPPRAELALPLSAPRLVHRLPALADVSLSMVPAGSVLLVVRGMIVAHSIQIGRASCRERV